MVVVVHCTSAYLALYNGFASADETPDVKMCQLTSDNREFKSKTFRVVVRLPIV